MQEVFEKIIMKLGIRAEKSEKKEMDAEHFEYAQMYKGERIAFGDAIKIVKQEAEQYNNGWIPCSEKLPELRKDVLVTVKYTGFMGMHGYWIKTGHMEAENDWWGDCAGGEVIAWKPLPEIYNGD